MAAEQEKLVKSAFADAGIEVRMPALEPDWPGIKPIPWQPQGEDSVTCPAPEQ